MQRSVDHKYVLLWFWYKTIKAVSDFCKHGSGWLRGEMEYIYWTRGNFFSTGTAFSSQFIESDREHVFVEKEQQFLYGI